MRLQVASDLHLEFGGPTPIDDTDADAIVLAGDTSNGADGVTWAARRWPDKPVLFVIGNHEPLGSTIDETLAACREAAAGTSVHVLERDRVEINGVRILGASLWTDFLLFGDPWATLCRESARRCMVDHREIGRSSHGKCLQPADTAALHQQTVWWLEAELFAAGDRPTVIVTHHAPSTRSLARGWECDLLSAAFASDAAASILQRFSPALWVHGHTHHAVDYQLANTRFLSNPLGYPGELAHWEPACVVEVG